MILGSTVTSAALLPWLVKRSGMWELTKDLNPLANPEIQHTIARFARYGLPFTLWFLSASLLSVGDRYILEWLRGPSAVGIYNVNYSLAQQSLAMLSGPFITAIWPRIMKVWTTNGRVAAQTLISHLTTVYWIFGSAIVGLLFLVHRPLMSILVGSRYVNGSIIVGPVAIGVLIWGTSIIGHKTVELTEQNMLMIIDAMIAAAVNLGLNIPLVIHFGLMGAAISTMVAYSIYTGLIWIQSQSRLPWHISFWRLGYIVLASLVASAGALLSTLAFRQPLLILLFRPLVFLLIYGALIYIKIGSPIAYLDPKGDHP